jgi:hypothetical protein
MCKCRNPSLGLTTKANVYKGASQEWVQESHVMLPKTQESVREWTPTLSLWELESQRTLEFSKGNYKSQNSLDWIICYIIEKLLDHIWAHITHLGT